MLRSLKYAVTFPTNGLSLAGDFTFQPGITAVTGRNGTGKSFGTIELWRFVLFGKKALRGPASDYKKLTVEAEFSVRDKIYRVTRGKSEKLYFGEETLATGADAVNKKLVEILGFGLEVFDVACAAVQKQSDRLSNTTPAKRKELIDEVVGLTQNEKVEKECKDEAKKLRIQADAILDNLRDPVAPTEPDRYVSSDTLQSQIVEAKAIEQERKRLQTIVDGVLQPPIPPLRARLDVQALEFHEEERRALETKRLSLEIVLRGIPETAYTEEQLDQAEALAEYDRHIAGLGPQPEVDIEIVEAGIEQWHHIKALKKAVVEVECPKCGHEFVPSEQTPSEPPYTLEYLEDQKQRHQRWSDLPKEPKGKRIPVSDIAVARSALSKADYRAEKVKELEGLAWMADLSADLKEARDIEREYQIYEYQLGLYEERRVAAILAVKELEGMFGPAISSDELNKQYVAARIYESELKRYETDLDNYTGDLAKANALTEEAAGFKKGAEALAEARRKLKAYLAPSLSRVASALIQTMTVGKLNSVVVNEDMEITVDGQDIATLSGAGSTAANLALRLALGQVLVSSVFPVFIGDEVDDGCDAERTQAIADCLGNLRGQLKQIILVTHKHLENVDQHIDLDG